MTTSPKCQAKNPATCVYHGNPTENQANALKAKIDSIFKKPVIVAPEFDKNSAQFTADIIIKPNNPAAKSTYKVTVHEGSYDKLMDKVEEEARYIQTGGARLLKELKTGYQLSVTLPSSAEDPNVRITNTEYNARPENIPKLLTERIAEEKEANAEIQATLEKLRHTPLGQTPQGIKTAAVIKTMAKFHYFKSYIESSMGAAWSAVGEEGTREYTNRGYGIRVHPSYDHKGELREARFSLDNPDSNWNTFSNEDVDKANLSLKLFFDKVNAKYNK